MLKNSAQSSQPTRRSKSSPEIEAKDGLARSWRLQQWVRLLAGYSTVQISIQLISLLCGILLVRRLTKSEYALFTITGTMTGVMNLLADSGIGVALTSMAGKVWDDPLRFSELIATALDLRRRTGLLAGCVIAPILGWLLIKNGANPWQAGGLLAIALANCYFQIGIGVLIIAPRMLLESGTLQRIEFVGAISRALVLLIAAFTFLNITIALISATIAFGIQWALLNRSLQGRVLIRVPTDPATRQAILKVVTIQAPNIIYYCLQGQVAIWLISIFGTSQRVADVGALGRISLIFNVIGSVLNSLIFPRFARCSEPRIIWRRFLQVVSTLAVLVAFLVCFAELLPEPFLLLLGPKYSYLTEELGIVVLAAGLGGVVATLAGLNFSRGWLISPLINIPLALTAQILAVSLFDISTVKGVVAIGMVPCLPEILLQLLSTRRGLRQLALERGTLGQQSATTTLT